MKKCNKCGQSKVFSDFPKSSYTKDKLYSLCRECKNLQNKKRKYVIGSDLINLEARKRHAERVLSDTEYVIKKRDSSRRSSSKSENRARINKTHRDWCKQNRNLRRESDRKQKARRRQITNDSAELINKNTIWIRDLGICGICGLPASFSNWHLDHIIPLSRGGTHIHDNVQVSHPLCNLKKNNRLPEEILNDS